jgi:competence protein ComGC
MRIVKTTLRPGRNKAFSLVELMILTSIIGILAVVSIPNYIKSRDQAQRATCVRNLKIIEHAVQEWAFIERKQATDTYSLTDPFLLAFFRGSRLPECPGGGAYQASTDISGVPTCGHAGHTL